MKLINFDQMTKIDKLSIDEYGIPGFLLMENAGIRCWDFINNYVKNNNLKTPNLVILAGSGNNGGDALVIARQAWISGFKKIDIIYNQGKDTEMIHLHRNICKKLGIPSTVYNENPGKAETAILNSTIIIDGITGTGLKGALRPNASNLVLLTNSSKAVKFSIDIPSGLGEDYLSDYPAVKADFTLTIGLPKTILYYPAFRNNSGEIFVIKIGFPPGLLSDPPGKFGNLYTEKDFKVQNLSPSTYKNLRGHVAVFAGSQGTSGAAVLSSSAAGRSRSGLVTIFADSDIFDIIASQSKSIMVKKLQRNKELILNKFTSILAGPGWGTNSRTPILKKIFNSKIYGVLDADGFNALNELEFLFVDKPGYLEGRWVFTPHPGEYSLICGIDKNVFLTNPLPYLEETAKKYGAVIVLKSHVTFIVTPDGSYSVVDGMNPSMGTGGTGDILSGIIAGFLAQGMSPYEGALMGVLLHQKIGRICFKEKGWFLAEDLLPYISSEIKKEQ
jgi:ADP-dependent NAD(P)H-hydrate dehydratase / NAD(P)H-hydrate epimerase